MFMLVEAFLGRWRLEGGSERIYFFESPSVSIWMVRVSFEFAPGFPRFD